MSVSSRQILDMNAFDPTRDSTPAGSLLARRQRNVGAASVLFYRKPLELRSAQGCWVEAMDGKRYLDFYNNVLSVGHSHPRVVEAVSRQMALLNINSRYLHPLTEDYLERLKATLPAQLEHLVLTCSGSEANDLALRMAVKASGGTGIVVTATAYHGNTAAVTAVSPASFKQSATLPDYVQTVPAPNSAVYGPDPGAGFARAVADAIALLRQRGHAPAALMCDSVFSSDGVFTDPPGFLTEAVAVMRANGGLYIADEVQPGFARTGESFWGFGRHGCVPDMVTMGKPMGNGFPLAGVATRPAWLESLCAEVGYFNTFGATPVAAAAGLAVLDVIADEGLQANALTMGRYLRNGLKSCASEYACMTEIRGAGLFIGVDIADPAEPDRPAPALASEIINCLQEQGVLIGAAGRYGHTLKLRPPLCLQQSEADFFLERLRQVLQQVITH